MTGEDGEGGRRRRWIVRVAAAAAALGLVAVAARVLSPGTSGTEGAAAGPALHRWDLVGCYELRIEPWRVQWREDSAGDARAPRASTDAEDGRATGPGSSGAPTARDGGGLPSSFRPPASLMLLADSVDRWGRVLPSRRAEPLDGSDRPGRSLRWLVRRDTLWLVWSEGGTRAGVALRRRGDSLVGRIRTIRSADSLDATAPASARRVNCWSRAPAPGVDGVVDRR